MAIYLSSCHNARWFVFFSFSISRLLINEYKSFIAHFSLLPVYESRRIETVKLVNAMSKMIRYDIQFSSPSYLSLTRISIYFVGCFFSPRILPLPDGLLSFSLYFLVSALWLVWCVICSLHFLQSTKQYMKITPTNNKRWKKKLIVSNEKSREREELKWPIGRPNVSNYFFFFVFDINRVRCGVCIGV